MKATSVLRFFELYGYLQQAAEDKETACLLPELADGKDGARCLQFRSAFHRIVFAILNDHNAGSRGGLQAVQGSVFRMIWVSYPAPWFGAAPHGLMRALAVKGESRAPDSGAAAAVVQWRRKEPK